jgi:hypothetical protein
MRIEANRDNGARAVFLWQGNRVQSAASTMKAVFMGCFAKYVVILAALSVLVVLITPAPDELPCTAVHKSPLAPAFLGNVTSVLVQPIRLDYPSVLAAPRFFGVTDVLSLKCAFLC